MSHEVVKYSRKTINLKYELPTFMWYKTTINPNPGFQDKRFEGFPSLINQSGIYENNKK